MPKVFSAGRPASPVKRIEPKRASFRERGYTSEWTRYSQAYRRKHPFCVLCYEQGLLTLVVQGATGVVDHKYPVADGGPMFPGDQGVWSLCNRHHALKGRWEQYARETGQMDQIVRWCDDPASRPKFRGDL